MASHNRFKTTSFEAVRDSVVGLGPDDKVRLLRHLKAEIGVAEEAVWNQDADLQSEIRETPAAYDAGGDALKTIQTVTFADLEAHPQMITDMLARHDSVPIFLERRGGTVSMGAALKYSRATDELLEEALAEYAQMKREGYGRDDGFAELEAARREYADRADE